MIPVIVIFDVGKTNKKLFVFDEQYVIQSELSVQLPETTDGDGFPCEDVYVLTDWVRNSFDQVLADERWEVRAVNFSGYGASLVYLDATGKVMAPLYNYLKPFPEKLLEQFHIRYGGNGRLALETASPLEGSLSSGLQLYRMRQESPFLFDRVRYALHLPQYLSYILSGEPVSDITSIGCHTGLWDFAQHRYHTWVTEEGVEDKLATLVPSDTCHLLHFSGRAIRVGTGLHDSSAALIPYLTSVNDPFLLLSTGTWCVSLNPFNQIALRLEELKQDCLCYLSYTGQPVKSSKVFSGNTHEHYTHKLSAHYGKSMGYFESVACSPTWTHQAEQDTVPYANLLLLGSYEEAYHHLMAHIVQQQVISTGLVLSEAPVPRILVDGGFSRNTLFMTMLANALPHVALQTASVAQASAIGAAKCLQQPWT